MFLTCDVKSLEVQQLYSPYCIDPVEFWIKNQNSLLNLMLLTLL